MSETQFNPDAIPSELRALPQWVLWRYEERGGKRTKVPYRIDGQRAKTTEPTDWSGFDQAVAASANFHGIGFVFVKNGGLVGIDLDNAIDEFDNLTPWASEIVEKFSTYAEISPSGKGLKLWCRGCLPGDRGRRTKCDDGAIEMYGAGRYFTVTGVKLEKAPSAITDCREQIEKLFKDLFADDAESAPTPSEPMNAKDEAIIRKILCEKNRKGARLWRGDTTRYPSQSEADAALCCKLAFYVGNDPDRIDRLFRQSQLFRDKWRKRADYRMATIARAIARTTARFDWSKNQRNADAKVEVKGHAPFALTDLGNAERLVAQHGNDLRFCAAWGAWLVWDGKKWAPDETGEVERRAKLTVRGIYHEAANIEDSRKREAVAEHAKRSESKKSITNMIALTQTEADVAITPGQLDAAPWLLNASNGIIDLRTGALEPHDRFKLITKLAPVEFDPNARLELLDRFLHTATDGNQAVIDFLQRAVGYSLTGVTSEEKFFFVHGPGAAGKSTFIESIKAMLGDYAKTADFESFLQRQQNGGARGDIARLVGARFVTSIEVEDGKRLAEGLVKQVTGGDTIVARYLYQSEFEFRPAFKLWLVANHAPKVREDDDAIWRRILRLPFEHVVPECERNPSVKATLTDPAQGGPALLAWAVRGCLEWQRIGLAAPSEIVAATASYRSEMDQLGEFIEEKCVENANGHVLSADLYRAYTRWCEDTGQRFPLRQQTLVGRMEARGFQRGMFGRDRKRGLSGLTLREHLRARERLIPGNFDDSPSRGDLTDFDAQALSAAQPVEASNALDNEE